MKSHEEPSQVAVALAGAAHGEQDDPHVAVALLLTQTPPQLWWPALQAETVHAPDEHAAVASGSKQPRPHRPQFALLVCRFVSQPLAALPSQLP